MTPRKLRRVVIKEELVAITGDFVEALILNQFMYWSERIQNVDAFIQEENSRRINHGIESIDLQEGWIYKRTEDLARELMIDYDPRTIRKKLNNLVGKVFLHVRRNPKYRWDRTLQYRVDFLQTEKALKAKNYALQGWKTLEKSEDAFLHFGEGKNVGAIPEITESGITCSLDKLRYDTDAMHRQQMDRAEAEYREETG